MHHPAASKADFHVAHLRSIWMVATKPQKLIISHEIICLINYEQQKSRSADLQEHETSRSLPDAGRRASAFAAIFFHE